jgi:hypothetical protein
VAVKDKAHRDGTRERKGFVITLDAIAALSLMLITLYFVQSAKFDPVALKGTELKQISLDTMTVLEKSGRISEVFFVNGTSVSEVLTATPPQVCMELTVTAENGSVVTVLDKPGCGQAVSESQYVYGAFRAGGVVFSSTLKSWYNQEVPG